MDASVVDTDSEERAGSWLLRISACSPDSPRSCGFLSGPGGPLSGFRGTGQLNQCNGDYDPLQSGEEVGVNRLTWRLVLGITRFAKELHVIEPQRVCVEDLFGDHERILDLGGGGEGVIGQLRGQQVVAVDIRKEELDEAPSGPVKVVADASALPFPDSSFDAATAFFFLMYVSATDRPAVLREA